MTSIPVPEEERTPRELRVLIAVGFFVSGAAGLLDQVVWSKYLALFIGSSTTALTVVLATFMGGLAIGNHLFGRRVDAAKDTRQALYYYAALELGIGLWCLAFPEILSVATAAYIAAAAPLGFGASGTAALKIALAGATILPPTILMGGTLPVLARVITSRVADVASKVGRLYFINSFGAAVGAAAAGFLIIPAVGLAPSIRASGILNLMLAAIFTLALRRPGLKHSTVAGVPGTTASDTSFTGAQRRTTMVVIGLAGAVSMLYEVVWTRLLSLVMGGSTYSFTIMVTTFITGITLGSLSVSRLFGRDGAGDDPLKWFAIAETGVFLSILPIVPLYDHLPFYFAMIASVLERSSDAFPLYLFVKVFITFLLMLLPTFFIGMTLPLASRVAVDRLEVLGKKVGSVFSVNTVGTVLGATLTGAFLLPILGLRGTLLLGVGMTGILALALWRVVHGIRPGRFGQVTVGLMLLFVGVLATGPWNALVLNFGMYRHKSFGYTNYSELLETLEPLNILYAEDGADTSVAVIQDSRTDSIYMKVNGKTDAGTGGDVSTQLWLGHLGMFLNPDAQRALVIGLGSGITAGSVLTHQDVGLDVIEISEAVVQGAEFFSNANGGALHDERMSLYVGDAKEFFKLQPDNRYDVIVSEPSNPWISGIGNLFSVQYFQEIHDHLNTKGVLVQWVHLYELNDELFRIIMNTVGTVFPHVEIWQCNGGDILLAASKSPIEVDTEHVQRVLNQPSVSNDLNRPALGRTLRTPEDFLLGQVLSSSRFKWFFPGEPPYNLDTHPRLEYAAPKAFFANQRADLIWSLDERRLPASVSRLHLAKYLRRTTLDSTRYNNVISVLGARGSASDGRLLKSIAWGVVTARDDAPERRRLVEQMLDPKWGERARSTDTTTSLQAISERQSEAVSVFFNPSSAGLAQSQPSVALSGPVLRALARRVDTEGLSSIELPDGVIADPLQYVRGTLSIESIRQLHLGHAFLLSDQAGCAVPALEQAQTESTDFPIPQLLARARQLAPQQPCRLRFETP